MVSLLLGIAAAAAASTLYSLGIAVQALDARETDVDHGLRVKLIGDLLRRRRWVAGTGMTVLGWPLQLLALSFAPLVIVQPALAAGLIVLLLVAQRMLAEAAGPREVLAVGAIVAGVAGMAILAPGRSTHHPSHLALAVALVVLGLACCLPYLLRMIGRPRPVVTMLGAGFCFAWSGLVTKLVSDALAGRHWGTALAWALATGVASGIGLLSEMSALQVRPAIQVAPVVFVVQTVVPVALAAVLLDEGFFATAYSGVPLLACLGVLLAGATVLARSRLLLVLTAAEKPAPAG
jgi:drug/metabolite transporter (DMT)-like permease